MACRSRRRQRSLANRPPWPQRASSPQGDRRSSTFPTGCECCSWSPWNQMTTRSGSAAPAAPRPNERRRHQEGPQAQGAVEGLAARDPGAGLLHGRGPAQSLRGPRRGGGHGPRSPGPKGSPRTQRSGPPSSTGSGTRPSGAASGAGRTQVLEVPRQAAGRDRDRGVPEPAAKAFGPRLRQPGRVREGNTGRPGGAVTLSAESFRLHPNTSAAPTPSRPRPGRGACRRCLTGPPSRLGRPAGRVGGHLSGLRRAPAHLISPAVNCRVRSRVIPPARPPRRLPALVHNAKPPESEGVRALRQDVRKPAVP
jgi:hypothetical protein